jgi:uncharacterized protein (DUF2141 family)
MKFDNKMSKAILLATSFFSILTARSQTVNITVTVNNIKSSKGTINVCVYNKETGFPEKPNLAIKCTNSTASKSVMQITIEGITPGKYAISAHHDENNDGKVNTNFLGIPKEPTGASNGAKAKMGPPKFGDAVIVIDKNKTQISIALH